MLLAVPISVQRMRVVLTPLYLRNHGFHGNLWAICMGEKNSIEFLPIQGHYCIEISSGHKTGPTEISTT